MKLFIVAVLISAVSAARLEHLERGYLPPDQNNYGANSGGNSFPTAGGHGNFGFTNQGSQNSAPGRVSNGFGAFGRSNDFASHGGKSNGFGNNGFNGFGATGRGSNGFGSNGAGNYGGNGLGSGRFSGSSAATSNQYLPPNYASSGSNGGNNFGSIKPCSSCGSSTFGSPQQYQQQPTFGSHGLSIPSTQYGSPQSFIPASTFDSQLSYNTQQDEPTGASRQYLAPKTPSFQSAGQQPFDEKTGYIY